MTKCILQADYYQRLKICNTSQEFDNIDTKPNVLKKVLKTVESIFFKHSANNVCIDSTVKKSLK